MKIAVLEWICGGGLTSPHADADCPLLAEGWGMLQCLAMQLASSGNDLVIPIDSRLQSHLRLQDLHSSLSQNTASYSLLTPPSFAESNDASVPLTESAHFRWIAQAWRECAAECDAAIVVAPEIDDILLHIIPALASVTKLLNCTQEFLRLACDKIAMSQRFTEAAISHPPTIPLPLATQAWLQQASGKNAQQRWVAKPANGAGCECLYLTDDPISLLSSETLPSNMILQPWIEGQALSCSGIAAADGHIHWLPLMTQKFVHREVEAEACCHGGQRPQQIKYSGAELADSHLQQRKPVELLRGAMRTLGSGALGWIGVDLTYDAASDRWTIIEVNPRCTSSMIPLSHAYGGNLVEALLGLSLGQQQHLQQAWNWES
ncbi:MAG: ATP-grasp domain-containing protein [bacterium]|nr:ATP-grasp domain-containing protein [bacterium]